MEYARDLGVKILAGILLLKSAGMARYLNRNVPGITVPDSVIKEMESSAHPVEMGVRIAARQVKQLQGICDGVHIMAIGMEEKVLDILNEAGI